MSIVFAVCDNFAGEVAATIQGEGWTDVEVVRFPAACGRPPLASGDLKAFRRFPDECLRVIGSACCSRLPAGGGLEGVERLAQCFELFVQPELLEAKLAAGAYVVTPGWLEHWEERVRDLGLDAATAPMLFSESASRVLLLDTGVGADCSARLEGFASFVGLPFERMSVGLGSTRLRLERLVAECRLELERRESLAALSRTGRQSAHFATSFDLVGRLTRIMTEKEALKAMREVFEMLFAPTRISYVAAWEEAAARPGGNGGRTAGEQAKLVMLGDDGFLVPITHQGERFGTMKVEGVSFPEHRDRYVELAGTLADVCGLALANARTFERVKRTEEALRGSEDRLRQADRRKDEFLASLSHELRTPLMPIRNSLYVLERSEPEGERAANARAVIRRQIEHLTRLVDDLLDVSRITRGKIRLRREAVDLADLVRRAVEDHRPAFEREGVSLEVSTPEEPLWLNADATRLAQVASNLLANAVKFTPRGGRVDIVLRREATHAVLRVRDTGVGIAPEVLKLVFHPFMQAEQALDRTRGGLGLGLALVKGLVDEHGGSVTALSEGLGRGTEFTVRLPLEATRPSEPDPGPLLKARPRRVLVIEDSIDGAQSLRDALGLMGHEVRVAYDGPSGIEEARAFRPDVVLCDIGLPGMDGYEVARALRSDETLAGLVLVALTGYAQAEDRARALRAGFTAHLPKPPSFEALEQVLAG